MGHESRYVHNCGIIHLAKELCKFNSHARNHSENLTKKMTEWGIKNKEVIRTYVNVMERSQWMCHKHRLGPALRGRTGFMELVQAEFPRNRDGKWTSLCPDVHWHVFYWQCMLLAEIRFCAEASSKSGGGNVDEASVLKSGLPWYFPYEMKITFRTLICSSFSVSFLEIMFPQISIRRCRCNPHGCLNHRHVLTMEYIACFFYLVHKIHMFAYLKHRFAAIWIVSLPQKIFLPHKMYIYLYQATRDFLANNLDHCTCCSVHKHPNVWA